MGKIKKIKKERAEERKKIRAEERKREAILPLQVLSREDYLTAIALSTLTFVVYAFTAAPGLTLADSADFIMGVLTLGIVHAPGFPLYTILGHLFSYLPFGDPAFRVNLFSALWGSLCLGVAFLNLRVLSIERIHAVFAILFLGFTSVFWSNTGIAEVYIFNVFLIACVVFWILSYNRDKKKSQLYLIFLTTGLALSNHYPIVVLSGVGLVFLLDRRDLQIGDYFKSLLFLGLGLTPYLYLFIQASNPELQYNFGQLSDFGMVLDHIQRKYYINVHGGTVWDKFILARTLLKAIFTNFLLSSLFLFFGIIFSFIERWKYRYPLLIAALLLPFGLILILSFPSSERFRSYLLDYSIPTFLFLSVFLALGLKNLMTRIVKTKMIQCCLLFILLITQVGFNFGSSSHHNDRIAEVWGTELLNSLRPNSILILCGRGQLAIYYQQLIKGLRQDVTLYDRFSAYSKENLYHPELVFKRFDAPEYRKRREEQLIKNSLRPIYYACKTALVGGNNNFSLTPFVYRADRRHFEASDFTRFTLSTRFLDSLVDGYPKSEYWIDLRRKEIFRRLISYYVANNLREVNRILDYLSKTKLYSEPEFIRSVENGLHSPKNQWPASNFSETSEKLSLEAFRPTHLALLCKIAANAGYNDKALAVCIQQEQSSAGCEAGTIEPLRTIARIYRDQENWGRMAEYARKILKCQPNDGTAKKYLKSATARIN